MARFTKFLTGLGLVLLLAGPVSAAVQVGKAAPDFKLTSIDGTDVSLSELSGKVVILEWFNRECPYVKKHYRNGDMQALQREAVAKGVVWLTIDSTSQGHRSFTAPAEFKTLVAALGISSTAVLSDASGDVGRTYGARTTPHMFIIGKDGTLLYQGAIDDNSSSHGDPKEAKNFVKAAIAEIEAGKAVSVSESKPYGCSVKYSN